MTPVGRREDDLLSDVVDWCYMLTTINLCHNKIIKNTSLDNFQLQQQLKWVAQKKMT